MEVVKRDGEVVQFNQSKIVDAILKASSRTKTGISENDTNIIVNNVIQEVTERFTDSELTLNVENIHDLVEKHLMHNNHFEVAKSYIVYRAQKRQKETENRTKLSFLKSLTVKKRDNSIAPFNPTKLTKNIKRHSKNLPIDTSLVFQETVKSVFDGMKTDDLDKALILSATSFIEQDPSYSILAASFFRQKLAKEVFNKSIEYQSNEWQTAYRQSFIDSINLGVKNGLLDGRLIEFDLKTLSDYLVLSRDDFFKYIGIHTLYEKYLLKVENRRTEMLQSFWMRVAMGLALNEDDINKRAIEFYDLMSQLLQIPSTPTLLHSGLVVSQMSSCYLNCVSDDLRNIFQTYSDNAQLSKWSGGIGTDWTNVRSTGAMVNTIKVESQGLIPFLKIANDTTVAINRSGKRRGAAVVYLETWHLDIEDFLDLRRNTGDERRRTHDINTANWIPDLFMKRVKDNGKWTLFSPDDVPDLHDLYGKKFEERYTYYEKLTLEGGIKRFKVLEAQKLYKKMLTILFETGNGWFCFKDPCNIRSPQDHVGVVHSSNLCCVAGDQLVVTNHGLLTVSEMYNKTNGWKLAGKDGIVNGSEMLLPRPNAPMRKIITDEGYTHKVTPDHKVWVIGHGYKEAQDLVPGDMLALQSTYGMWGGTEEATREYLKELYGSSSIFKTNDLKLAEKVQIIQLNFGIKTLIIKIKDYYVLIKDYQNQEKYAVFNRLEVQPNEDAYCLEVDAEDHLWTVNGFLTKNTEITLNTKPSIRNEYGLVKELGECSVCNLSSLNLSRHVIKVNSKYKIDWEKLKKTIYTAIRMLDNVIDINFYPIPEAHNSNLKHRPIGLGLMGMQDVLFLLDILYEESGDLQDEIQEFISYHAILASSMLAIERGIYQTYKGSKWDKGIFPLDTLDLLEEERETKINVDRKCRLDWQVVKDHVKKHGMRNSNVLASAPTATISTIAGVLGPVFEPTYKNIFTKSNMSGEFVIVNEYLVDDLKKEGLWNKDMLDTIKYHNGSIQKIDKIPIKLRKKYKESFEIDPKIAIDITALRGKWIDQSQSHNVFISSNSGKVLYDVYMYAWEKSLKSTYYLRSLGISGVEKSTLDTKFGLTQKRNEEVKACSLLDPTCESCQ